MNKFKTGASIMKDNKIKAVHDKDLVELLQSLNVYNDVIHGNYKCLFCGNTITIDNIASIVPYENTVQFTCDSTDCHQKFIMGVKK